MNDSATIMLCSTLLMILTVTSINAYSMIIAEGAEDCLAKCNQTKQQVVCMDCIPVLVPGSVREVVLKQLQYHRLAPRGFCAVSWRNVTQLTIQYDNFRFEEYNIPDYAFECLEKINRIKLDIHYLSKLSKRTLSGLLNVSVLDFSNCRKLETFAVTNSLSLKQVLPKLSTLVLSNMGTYSGGVDIYQAFIDVLDDRNLTELNLSNSVVKFGNPSMTRFCEHIKTLNLSNCVIRHTSNWSLPVCMSLQIVDLSFVQFPRAYTWPRNITVPYMTLKVGQDWFNTLSSVSVLYLNQILSEDHFIFILNSTLKFVFNNSIKEIHLSGYSVPVCEAEFIFEPNHLQYFDLSNNKIETIGPKCFNRLSHLERLDLSYNKLSASGSFENTFTNLFKTSSKLKELSLVSNGLSRLPLSTFSGNRNLQYLYLSRNNIHQINFAITNLLNLVYIDLRKNSVENLNSWSRSQIDLLRQKQQKLETNKTFVIDLRDNPLSCGCQSLDFIKWFIDSPVYASTRELYHCQLDGQRIPMTITAVEAAENDCNKPTRRLRKLLLSTLLPCASCAAMVLTIILVVRKYRIYNKYRRLQDQIERIQNDHCAFQFPAFLSFSSEDSEFVMLNILGPLEAHLKTITGTNRDMVAMGDRHFRLGRSIFAEIIRCLQKCAVVVVVLSNNFCRSEYCRLEIEQARLMRKPIVIIIKEHVNEDEMDTVIKETFKHFVRATFRSEDEAFVLQQDWAYICECIIQLS